MIDRRTIRGAAAATAAVLVLSQIGVGSAAPLVARTPRVVSATECPSTWQTVASPSVPGGFFIGNALLAASATSASDVWAVGDYASSTASNATGRTMTLHWDGSSWTLIKGVDPTNGNDYLSGVVAISPNEVYAVGTFKTRSARSALIEENTGSGWAVVHAPTIGTDSFLYSAAAAGSTDIWAFGEFIGGKPKRTQALVLHSDGTGFRQSPADASVSGTNRFYGGTAISPGDVWAVGVVTQAGPLQTLAEHWDGNGWARVPSPTISTTTNSLLTSISGTSTTDVWAVGQFDQPDGTLHPLIEHWDGSAWVVTPSPTPGIANARLFNVVARSATDAWAIGSFFDGTKNQPFGMHWNGNKWRVVSMPGGTPNSETNLYGLVWTPLGDLWAVGATAGQTLTDHLCPPDSTSTAVFAEPNPSMFGQDATFTATVTPTSPSLTTPTGTVTFYIDGQTTPVATVDLVSGQASFTTSGLGAGSHTVTAVYSGDANLDSSTSAPAALTVTTATTIMGDHPGALVVASGSTVLLSGATVGGAVIVQPGGSLDVEDSTMASLNASAPGALRVCGSNVHGAVSVGGARRFVLIGDPGDDSCPPNTIGGGLVLRGNHSGLEAIANRVAGALTATANSGAGPFPEDATPDISGNGP